MSHLLHLKNLSIEPMGEWLVGWHQSGPLKPMALQIISDDKLRQGCSGLGP